MSPVDGHRVGTLPPRLPAHGSVLVWVQLGPSYEASELETPARRGEQEVRRGTHGLLGARAVGPRAGHRRSAWPPSKPHSVGPAEPAEPCDPSAGRVCAKHARQHASNTADRGEGRRGRGASPLALLRRAWVSRTPALLAGRTCSRHGRCVPGGRRSRAPATRRLRFSNN